MENKMPFSRRVGDDPVSGKIDNLMLSTDSQESKAVLNTLRSINDKIETIADYLHDAHLATHETEQKMIKVLESLQLRQEQHEKDFAENKAKLSVWRQMINGLSVLLLAFSAWACNEYFNFRDSKLRLESRLEVAERLITNNQNDVLALREVVNTLRIDKVQDQVGILKKKHARLDSLMVIKNSKVAR